MNTKLIEEIEQNEREVWARVVCFIHNHPSGDPAPSQDDRAITIRLKKASEILGIRIIDHVIIGRDGYFSFESEGILS